MRLRVLPVTTALTVLALLTSCSADGDEPTDRAERSRIEGPDVRPPVRPQVIRSDNKLLACANGEEGAAARVASILVPKDYDSYTGFTVTDLYREDHGPEAGSVVCFLGRTVPMGFRRPRHSSFSITMPTQEPLRAAVERFALRRGPRPVVEQVAVLGSPDGERATYRARESGSGRVYDAVAVQTGGIRLTWIGPTRSRVPRGSERRDRRLWQQVQDSLAVRAPAASDGDADAESDPDAPEEATNVLAELAPAGAARHPRFRAVRCAARKGTVTLLLPDRIPDYRHCSWVRPLPSPWEGEQVDVVLGPRASLREEYELQHELEDDGGDADTDDVEYDNDVPGPGDLRTESLVYTSADDGAPREHHLVQVGGVRLDWSVLPGTWGPQAEELAVVLASLAVSPR